MKKTGFITVTHHGAPPFRPGAVFIPGRPPYALGMPTEDPAQDGRTGPAMIPKRVAEYALGLRSPSRGHMRLRSTGLAPACAPL